MPKLRKYEHRIRKYKEKLKKFVIRIGLQHSEEFELYDETLTQLILPCHIGILFYGDFNKKLFDQIRFHISQTFDSFFFEIRHLGKFDFSKELLSKGVKKEFKEQRKANEELSIHPTNKFYQVLIDKRVQEKLGMIITITDLPIYSSDDDNIRFLFGETHLKHRCCIVSTFKLKEQFYGRQRDMILFFQRVIKEVIHEIGHLLLGAEHCEVSSCVMRFSKSIEEIEVKSFKLCKDCELKLSKIRDQYNF
ncbi:MAG: hypothetical protein ACW986_06805 [Promethearchaeota archaeon]|jgi:predicted Zn-dependent protease